MALEQLNLGRSDKNGRQSLKRKRNASTPSMAMDGIEIGLKKKLDKFHGVKVADGPDGKFLKCEVRYLTGRFFTRLRMMWETILQALFFYDIVKIYEARHRKKEPSWQKLNFPDHSRELEPKLDPLPEGFEMEDKKMSEAKTCIWSQAKNAAENPKFETAQAVAADFKQIMGADNHGDADNAATSQHFDDDASFYAQHQRHSAGVRDEVQASCSASTLEKDEVANFSRKISDAKVELNSEFDSVTSQCKKDYNAMVYERKELERRGTEHDRNIRTTTKPPDLSCLGRPHWVCLRQMSGKSNVAQQLENLIRMQQDEITKLRDCDKDSILKSLESLPNKTGCKKANERELSPRLDSENVFEYLSTKEASRNSQFPDLPMDEVALNAGETTFRHTDDIPIDQEYVDDTDQSQVIGGYPVDIYLEEFFAHLSPLITNDEMMA